MSRADTGPDARVVGAIAGIIVVLIGIIVVGLLTVDDGEPTAIEGGVLPTATPTVTPTSPTPSTAAPSAPAGPAAADPAAPAVDGEDGSGAAPAPPPAEDPPREPTDADAAAFVEVIRGEDMVDPEVVLTDLDDDGRNEVVVASVLGGVSRIDVAGWTGTAYRLTYSGEGATAEEIVRVRVADINGTADTEEIVVAQRSGSEGASLSLWGLRGGEVVPLRAVDGCWDGSHTYGIIGAEVDPPRIIATCDGSPDPTVAWPSDVYVWEPALDAFAYERTLD